MWGDVCRFLEQSVIRYKLKTWIEPLKCLSITPDDDGLTVRLEAPNVFSRDWVKDQSLVEPIEGAFNSITGKQCKVELCISSRAEPTDRTTPHHPPFALEEAPADILRAEPPKGVLLSVGEQRTGSPALSGKYVFDNFVVGASNQFAHASAVAVAERPAEQYNPLFIYSSSGLGKTHLLHAIGNRCLERDPKTHILYIPAEYFINDVVESIRRNQMNAFRNRFRNSLDVLLIDDIQSIAGKKSTEDEFFHTFNALYSAKRQVVLTSDSPPSEIEGLAERIRTRFEWGLVTEISIPEIETRIAILKSKAESDDIYLPNEVATFIATHIKSDVRKLEGILAKLQLQSTLTGAEITLDSAKQEFRNMVPEESSALTVETILNAVVQHFNVRIADLKSSTRKKKITLPRHIAIFLIRKYTGLPLEKLGSYFGGRDHSTVTHALNKIQQEIEIDSGIKKSVEAIQNRL